MREKGFTPIIVILVLALISALGFFTYSKTYLKQSSKEIKPSIKPLNSSTPILSPSIIISPVTVNGWKINTDTQHNFKFEYPPSWQSNIKEFGSEGYFITKSNNNITFTAKIDPAQSLLDFLKNIDELVDTKGNPFKQIQSQKNIQIADIMCIQRNEYIHGTDETNIATYCKYGNVFITFTLIPKPGSELETDMNDYNKTISTFSFSSSNASSDDVVTGEVYFYRPTQDGYTVQFIASSTKGSVTQMMVWTDSNQTKKWQNYTEFLSVPKIDKVYVKYRDNLGVESDIYMDSSSPEQGPPEMF